MGPVDHIGKSEKILMMELFKKRMHIILRKVGLYHRLKASCLYEFFWLLADKRIVEQKRMEMKFYQNLLTGFKSGDLIIDIGANQGAKTDTFLRMGAKVVAVDPDELNQEILKQKFTKYRLSRKPVTILGKAVSDKKGVETFWIQEPGSAMNTLSRKWVEALRGDDSRFNCDFQYSQSKEIETLTLQDLRSAYGEPVFVKIDVEGYEPHVIGGMRTPVACLSFEVNLPEFREEGKKCVGLLMQLSEHGIFNYTKDLRQGLALTEWVYGKEFHNILDRCEEKSIEVFWKTSKSHCTNNEGRV